MNDLQAIRARIEATYAGEPVGQVVADVMFLLLENVRLKKELQRHSGYAAFVNTCIRSGERPDTFEQYCKEMDAYRESVENSPRGEN